MEKLSRRYRANCPVTFSCTSHHCKCESFLSEIGFGEKKYEIKDFYTFVAFYVAVPFRYQMSNNFISLFDFFFFSCVVYYYYDSSRGVMIRFI